jgi:hypothetical protein
MRNFLAFFTLMMIGSAAFAGYTMGDKKPLKKAKKTTAVKRSSPSDETQVLNALSQRFNVDVEKLRYFRSLKNGYEEIVPALIVAREAQVEIGKILQARMEDQTWKEIAEAHSIELKPLNTEVVEILEPIKNVLPAKAITERPRVHK